MSKFVRSFADKGAAKAWIEKCKKSIRGCYYGNVAATNSGGNYHASIFGEFTEAEARAQCPAGIRYGRYEP